MAKITDTQLFVLSKAAARKDAIATIPEGLNKAAAAKVVASLVSRKLMREVRSKPDMPVWREDEEGRGTSLVITREGRDAIGIEDSSEEATRAKEKRRVVGRQPSPRNRSTTVGEPRTATESPFRLLTLPSKE